MDQHITHYHNCFILLNFQVELSGTWFSGHSASVRGFYQDKSTTRALNHHLKLLLKSGSFHDVSMNLLFSRSNDELKIDFKVGLDYIVRVFSL